MTQNNPLDQTGSLQVYPLAELLVELGQGCLSGSLRVFRADQKTVFYFDQGNVVFAVSNSKALRLFNIMIKNGKIAKEKLSAFPNFANDMEFSMSLENSGEFSKIELCEMFTLQIESIIGDALLWREGEWHFSPLARLRGDIRYHPNLHRLLMEHARCIPAPAVAKRFRSLDESFRVSHDAANPQVLQAHETYVLERFQNMPLSIAQLRSMCSMPESGILQALYVLWLGGSLVRENWNAAFSPVKMGEILAAKMRKVKSADDVDHNLGQPPREEASQIPAESSPPQALKAAEIKLSLSEYLKQVEKAETHYDTLGLAPEAKVIDIKSTYFGLAKLFHPDKFHRESAATLKRIQAAFTTLAHAYETLKDEEARESYNFKMRKEIDAREKRIQNGGLADGLVDNKKEAALQSFEQALICLKQEDYEQAVTLLGRAVHYSPENPQFHAYYGKALSAFEGQDHKALGEFQTAVKIAPTDEKIRLMLVDFLLEIDMQKRAVGELNRFLELVPESREAQKRLTKLGS